MTLEITGGRLEKRAESPAPAPPSCMTGVVTTPKEAARFFATIDR